MATILLIEDDERWASTLMLILSTAGHEIDWSNTLEGALAFLIDTEYDLVICDDNVYGGDGLQFSLDLHERFAQPTMIASVRDMPEGFSLPYYLKQTLGADGTSLVEFVQEQLRAIA